MEDEKKFFTTTNVLAIIGAIWLLWFFNIFLMRYFYVR